MATFPAEMAAPGPDIAIVGAGFAGICMGIRLKQAGIDSFTIFEKADRVGGVWRDNTYPGATCDVPSVAYSFSFEPRLDWPDVYSSQIEIQKYLETCVAKYGLGPHIRFCSEIERLRFGSYAGTWKLQTKRAEVHEAEVVVVGVGQLNRPQFPDIPGLDEFAGMMFHSAHWNHDHDLAGRRVAVVGNGASAIQFIPKIASEAELLTVFQRTPNWMIPHLPRNRSYRRWEKWAMQRVPLFARAHRAVIYALYEARLPAFRKGSVIGRLLQWRARRHMLAQVQDPRLREMLTPDYPIGCKRILLSSDYYPALVRPNVRVVGEPIERVTPDGVLACDGTLHRADTLILATGFDVQNYLAPIEIEGVDGHRLPENWRDGAEAYLGVAVSGFPNLFLTYGPNSSLGHHSIIAMIESQVHYIMQCVHHFRRTRNVLNVRPDIQSIYNRWLHSRLKNRVWDADCKSWYKTTDGKITALWPDSTIAYRRRMRRFDPAEFERGQE